MKKITHYQKVMWRLYCEYSHLEKEKWSTSYNLYNADGEFQKTVVNNYERRSNKQWDFINAKFYYVTKIDPIYDGTKKEFADYLEPYVTYWGSKHRKSPYDETKPNPASNRRRFSWYGWYKRRYPTYSKWQKRPKHVKKKVLSEKERAKREWREFKQVRKDKAKPYWQLGRKAYWTKMGRKCERRYVRQELAKGNYDLEMDDRAFVNPWDWD